MPDAVIAQRTPAASKINGPLCVFFCEYVPRDKMWRWTWKAVAEEAEVSFAVRAFATLNDCVQDAAHHGFGRDHISIRYSARQPALSLLEKLDDRSKEFMRALRGLISAARSRSRPTTTPHVENWQSAKQDGATWEFSGSPHVTPGELSATNHLR